MIHDTKKIRRAYEDASIYGMGVLKSRQGNLEHIPYPEILKLVEIVKQLTDEDCWTCGAPVALLVDRQSGASWCECSNPECEAQN